METLLTACLTVRIPAEAQVIIHVPPLVPFFLIACVIARASKPHAAFTLVQRQFGAWPFTSLRK